VSRQLPEPAGLDSLSSHEFRREHVPILWSFAVHDLLIQLPTLLHDKIQHVPAVIDHIGVWLGKQGVDSFAEK
jgi:hypothetical protein